MPPNLISSLLQAPSGGQRLAQALEGLNAEFGRQKISRAGRTLLNRARFNDDGMPTTEDWLQVAREHNLGPKGLASLAEMIKESKALNVPSFQERVGIETEAQKEINEAQTKNALDIAREEAKWKLITTPVKLYKVTDDGRVVHRTAVPGTERYQRFINDDFKEGEVTGTRDPKMTGGIKGRTSELFALADAMGVARTPENLKRISEEYLQPMYGHAMNEEEFQLLLNLFKTIMGRQLRADPEAALQGVKRAVKDFEDQVEGGASRSFQPSSEAMKIRKQVEDKHITAEEGLRRLKKLEPDKWAW